MTTTAERPTGPWPGRVRTALAAQYVGLGATYYYWLGTLGMTDLTSLAVWTITSAACAAAPLVLWLIAGRTFTLGPWMAAGLAVPGYLGGLLGLASGMAGWFAPINGVILLGILVFLLVGVLRDRRRETQHVRS